MFSSLAAALRHNGQYFPKKIAIYYQDQEISFGELLHRSECVANVLRYMGVRKQDRVAVMSQNRPEFIEIYGAGELSGVVVTTVNFRLTAAEVKAILQSSEPKVVFFEEQYVQIFQELKDKLDFVEEYVCFGDAPDWAKTYEAYVSTNVQQGAFSSWSVSSDDILHLIYTSGTTGKPKGVMRSHYAELKVAEILATEIGITIDDRVQLMMPLFHVGARWVQMAAHFRGAAIVLHQGFEPEVVVQEMARREVTISHMAPTMVQAVLSVPALDKLTSASVHTICYSAAPMPVPLLQRGIAQFGNVFLQLYAMTESAGGTTLNKFQHVLEGAQLASIGQPMRGVQIRVADVNGVDVPVGEVGEVVIFTEARMSGYWKDPIATSEVLRDGWYFTGDMGRIDEDGYIYLVDRKKDMIITGGENVYSREVEAALATHPDVLDCAVIGIPDEYWGESVHALIVPKEASSLTQELLVSHCLLHIASYKKPRSIDFVPELPRLASGKVDKVVLRKRAVRKAANAETKELQ